MKKIPKKYESLTVPLAKYNRLLREHDRLKAEHRILHEERNHLSSVVMDLLDVKPLPRMKKLLEKPGFFDSFWKHWWYHINQTLGGKS